MKPNKPKRSFTPTAFNVQSDISMIGGRLVRSSSSGASTGAKTDTNNFTTFTVDVCVDGVTKKLDVYVAGPPYDPPTP
jgi:hypothetical protein